MATFDLSRRAVAECLGTWLLVATVVGSGIMAERLAGGNAAVALLGNTIATGAILVVLIAILAPISGAHFNPAVSLIFAIAGERDHPWLPPLPARPDPWRGRVVCGGRLLVYRVDLLRQPRGRNCTQPDRYLRRHPANRRAVVHRCRVGAILAALLFRWLLSEARQRGDIPAPAPTRLAK